MKIAVVGAGFVGMATAYQLAATELQTQAGYELVVYDKNKDVITAHKAQNWVHDISMSAVHFTADAADVATADVVIICVPTNLKQGNLDDSIVRSVIESTPNAKHIIRSTLPLNTRLFQHSPSAVYMPEFLREANAYQDVAQPSRVVIGTNHAGGVKVADCLKLFDYADPSYPPECVHVVRPEEASAIKLFSNSYLAMRVAFFNELDTYANENHLDAKAIIAGVCDDLRIGNYYNKTSAGFSGICLPKDLSACAEVVGSELLHAVRSSNGQRQRDVVRRLAEMHSHINIINYTGGTRNECDAQVVAALKKLKPNIVVNTYEGTSVPEQYASFPSIDLRNLA